MYTSIESFIQNFKNESQSTLKVFSYLDNNSLDKTAFDGGRTIGFLAWHIVYTLSEMTATAGVDFGITLDGTHEPQSKEEIILNYEKLADAIIEKLPEMWKDENLVDEINMYGSTWTKAQTLDALIKHEIHHRGQLTVYMRILGLRVPGIYGPSKEEWSQIGAPVAK